MNFKILILITSVLMFFSFSCTHNSKANKQKKHYSNGTFNGESRSIYTSESFYGKVTLVLRNDTIKSIEFLIRDSANHENFDSNYEKHFTGNKLYVDQCKNDWKGVNCYPKYLIREQNIENLDATTGATWSFNIFKSSVEEALNKALK